MPEPVSPGDDDTGSTGGGGGSEPHHWWRLVTIWLIASVVAEVLWLSSWSPTCLREG